LTRSELKGQGIEHFVLQEVHNRVADPFIGCIWVIELIGEDRPQRNPKIESYFEMTVAPAHHGDLPVVSRQSNNRTTRNSDAASDNRQTRTHFSNVAHGKPLLARANAKNLLKIALQSRNDIRRIQTFEPRPKMVLAETPQFASINRTLDARWFCRHVRDLTCPGKWRADA